jgi:glycosyltransferase involved in cell wall biosynthesis
MSATQSGRPVLLVADQPGHIIERISRSYARNAAEVCYEVAVTANTSNYALCRRASQVGIIHWMDSLRFINGGGGVTAPQAVMVHHLTDDQVPKMLRKLPLADGVTTSSVYWQRRLEELSNREVFLFPYPIDTDAFPYQEDNTAEKWAAGIQLDEFCIGFVGKAKADHAGRKGVDLLMRVLAAAAQQWQPLRLILVGPGWDKLIVEIEALGVRVSNFFYATTEETVDAYRLMDVLLVTSTEEGGPCTILEAMCCGVPVVTSVVGHVPEVVQDGETGFLCPQRTEGECMQPLAWIRTDTDLRSRLIRQARTFVEQERDERILVPRLHLQEFYDNAVRSFAARSTGEKSARAVQQLNFYVRHIVRKFKANL